VKARRQNAAATPPNTKKGWVQTPNAFRRLLAWLDQGVDSQGEKYLEMRRRLVSYFDRKRCSSPDDLADETLNRIARRLDEQGTVVDIPPARYCYILARFVFLEYLRGADRGQASFEDIHAFGGTVPAFGAVSALDTSADVGDTFLESLDDCLQQLERSDRELILEYYRGEQAGKIEHRRQLAARLGVTANALSIRACRIRSKLENCVSARLRGK
jgi:DNA-directed RNA polymerase specialized sigma24 family protein